MDIFCSLLVGFLLKSTVLCFFFVRIMNPSVLLTAPVSSTLKNMTVPMMFGLVMLMSFNLIDTFYVSLLGTQSLAAFSFTFPVTFTLTSLAFGLGIGISAVVAKTLGQ